MGLSYGKFGSMAPKVMVFKGQATTRERASKKTNHKMNVWFDEKGDNIKVYRMRAVTRESWFGLWVTTRFYVFYKDIPR